MNNLDALSIVLNLTEDCSGKGGEMVMCYTGTLSHLSQKEVVSDVYWI